MIAEFAPAFVLLLLAFFAILSVAQLLLYQMAAQKCCLDAATLAASSLTIKTGKEVVEQQAKKFNSGLGGMILLNNGKDQLLLQLTWTPAAVTSKLDQSPTERYATVTGDIVVQPFCLPVTIKLNSASQCVLEHPEGWVSRAPTSSSKQTY